jgi:hypothetical protein
MCGLAGYNGKVGEAKYTLAAGYHTYNKSLINEGSAAFSLNAVNDEDKYELSIGYLSGSDFGDGLSKTNKKGHRVRVATK